MNTPSPKKTPASPPALARATRKARRMALEFSPEPSPVRAKESNKRRAEEITENACMECGEDMGSDNPRQLCGKTRCVNPDRRRCTSTASTFMEPELEDEDNDYKEWSASLEAYREFRSKYDTWDKLTQFFILRDLCHDEGGITKLI